MFRTDDTYRGVRVGDRVRVTNIKAALCGCYGDVHAGWQTQNGMVWVVVLPKADLATDGKLRDVEEVFYEHEIARVEVR